LEELFKGVEGIGNPKQLQALRLGISRNTLYRKWKEN
jgi:hypothetical protein